MKTIEIIVTPEGRTTVQTLGFIGPSCRDASRFLEEALGRREAEQRTSEFFEQSAEPIRQQQRG